MPLANVIDSGMLFNASFADTSQQTSAECGVSERYDGLAVLIAPSGVNVSALVQVQDPAGAWHTTSGTISVLDGDCWVEVLPFNPGRVRVLITPSSGAGSADVWARAQGG